MVFDPHYEYQILIENITKDSLAGKIIERTKSEREPAKKLLAWEGDKKPSTKSSCGQK